MRGLPRRGRMNAIQERVADAFEIPRDALLDMPRMVVVGNAELVLENHLGVVEYKQDRVRVATGKGEITVEGKGLSIARILKHEISIEGQIRHIGLWV